MVRGAKQARTVAALLLGAGLWLPGPARAQSANDPASFWNEVTLYRGEYGTPHIHASSVRSMAFGFGYAQAEDHLEPMLMAYRVAIGRAAEVGGEAFAESDAFAIKIANADAATAALVAADPLTVDLCEGFALGVNAWLLDHRDQAPPWAEGVQPKDVLAWWHYLMVASAPFDLSGVYHPEPPLARANAWALAPEKTVEGATLLVMSPFQHYDGPYRWYEAHLMAGNMNWAGATIFGLPVLLMGHNEQLGWALTPNGADTADFFREEIGTSQQAPNDPRVFSSVIDDVAPLLAFMSNARPYYVRTAAGLVERAVPSHIGARGPIFEGTDGALYSWRNSAYGQFGGLRQLLLMGQATDLATFQGAVAMQQFPGFQILYADKAGSLFYAYNARIGNKNAAIDANRPREIDWTRPQESVRDMFAWRELIPMAQLPHIQDPESGFLQACGTPPWLATVNSGLNAADWPGWLAPELPSYRVFRVNQILSGGPYSFADMRAMLFDTLVPAAVDMAPLLLAMAEARPELVRVAHPDLVTALRLLRDWDLQADPNSNAMAYYNIWWALMVKRHAGEFASEAGLYQALLSNTQAAQGYALDAAVEAARVMRNDFNSLSIPWGSLHRIHRGTRNEAIFGASTGDPIFLSDSQTFQNRQWHASFGYGFAMAVQFGEETQAATIVPFGASENPASPHFDDQMDLFLSRDMKRSRFQYRSMIGHAAVAYGRRVVLGSPGVDGYYALNLDRPSWVKLAEIPDPPRPYPGSLAPFTPAIRPELDDAAAPVTWSLELSVPADRCRPEHGGQLRLFSYTQENGWTPLPGGRFDAARGVYSGEGSGTPMVAVLGPHGFRLDTAPAPEAVAENAVEPEPSSEFLRAPVAVEGPDSEGLNGTDVVPIDPAAGGEAGTMTPPAIPKNPYFDVEYLDQQPRGAGYNGAGVLGQEGAEAAPEEKKRGIFAPLRNLKKSAPRKNFNG